MSPKLSLAILFLISALPSSGGCPDSLTAESYAGAARFLPRRANPLVYGNVDSVRWFPTDRLVYRTTIADGYRFIAVDATRSRKTDLFDHQKMAQSLSDVTGSTFTPFHLPFTPGKISPDGRTIRFNYEGVGYSCDLKDLKWTTGPMHDTDMVVSPDGRRGVFIRGYNLWLVDLGSGRETRLTTDGVEDYGYATNNAGWIRKSKPVVCWSPQSDKIATFRQDTRDVGEMYLLSTGIGHSRLDRWRGALAGDSAIAMVERVIIHVNGPRVVRLNIPADPQRSTITDHIAGRGGELLDAEWTPDGSRFLFVSVSRDYRTATLRIADAASGLVRDVFSETTNTFFESGRDRVNWHLIPSTHQVLWFSERDDRGHLYLYDLNSGSLVRQLTRGEWNVLQVVHIDGTRIWFTGSGREGGDPYFAYLYSMTTDGQEPLLLTPEHANHEVSFSSSGRFFLDEYSTLEIPPVTVLRDLDGKQLMTLERADISSLKEWVPPKEIVVKARDGNTDLYGLMYLPTDFDSMQSYPIVNYVYPGPQTGPIGSRSFTAGHKGEQALAQLGFAVIEVDALGTPGRSKSFHEAYYGNMGDNGIPDQIAAIRQLAGRFSWLDTTRIGIWGHSGGGYAAADAILRYPDFYKVAVSEAGNHDNRNYEDAWAEKWQGLLMRSPDGSTNYDNQANELLARNLKGKLLLAHGTTDDNVPPSNTLLLADSLIAANKDFDLLLLPNRRHGFGDEPYMVRRRWDYFVRWLQRCEPPEVDLSIFRKR